MGSLLRVEAVYGSVAFLSKLPWLRTAALFLLLGLTAQVAPASLDEEEAPVVSEIVLRGNEAFSDGALKKLMRTRERRFFQIFGQPRYVRDWLRSDLATLEAHYHRAGFYEATLSSLGESDIQFDPESYSVRILIHVEEGKRRYLRRLSFAPAAELPVKKLLDQLSLREGLPFDPQAPGVDHFRILRVMQEEGRFSATVRHEIQLIETPTYAPSDSVDLRFVVEKGPRARLGEILITGNSLPDEIIRRELSLKTGEDLALEGILDSKQNLFDTGYFRSIDYRLERMGMGPEGEAEDLRLNWIFRERQMASLEGGVGIGSVDGFRLLGGWTQRNLFNRGQRMAIEGKISLKEEGDNQFGLSFERQSLEYRFLRIVRLRASLGLLLFREKDYEQPTGLTSLETRAVRLSAARRLDPYTVLRLREQFDWLDQKITDPELAASNPQTATRSLTLVVDRDTRNHYFSPTRGGQALASYEIAGGIQRGDHHFHRLQLSMSRHGRFGGGVLAGRLFSGAVWAYGESKRTRQEGVPADGVPFVERFYCGGGSTVRGYEENGLGPRLSPEEIGAVPSLHGQDLPVGIKGGRFMLVANLEWRASLFGNFGGVFFLDGGNTWQDWKGIRGSAALPWQAGEQDDFRRVFYGYGVGLRYLTPLTVLRLDFGVPLQVIEIMEEDGSRVEHTGGRWHVSLGHTF